jgi:hypothetical protein
VGRGGINFDLVAQAIDINLQQVVLAQVFSSPDMFEQQILGEDAPGVLGQVRDDAIFGGGERELFPGQSGQMLGIVDGEIAGVIVACNPCADSFSLNCERRRTARTRASNSSTLNGLVR